MNKGVYGAVHWQRRPVAITLFATANGTLGFHQYAGRAKGKTPRKAKTAELCSANRPPPAGGQKRTDNSPSPLGLKKQKKSNGDYCVIAITIARHRKELRKKIKKSEKCAKRVAIMP